MFQIDSQKIAAQLTSMEWSYVEGMVNTTRTSHIEARKAQHKTMAQRSERFLKWFLDNNAALVELAEMETKIKGRRMPSESSTEWANLSQQLFN